MQSMHRYILQTFHLDNYMLGLPLHEMEGSTSEATSKHHQLPHVSRLLMNYEVTCKTVLTMVRVQYTIYARKLPTEWLDEIWKPDVFIKNVREIKFHTMPTGIPYHFLRMEEDNELTYGVK